MRYYRTRRPATLFLADALRTRKVHRAVVEGAALNYANDPATSALFKQRNVIITKTGALRGLLLQASAQGTAKDVKKPDGADRTSRSRA